MEDLPLIVDDSRAPRENCRFRLYIAGNSAQSRRALRLVGNLMETCLGGRAQVEVIDIYRETERARADHVFAVPALIRDLPGHRRPLLSDFSDRRRVLLALDIDPDDDDKPSPPNEHGIHSYCS